MEAELPARHSQRGLWEREFMISYLLSNKKGFAMNPFLSRSQRLVGNENHETLFHIIIKPIILTAGEYHNFSYYALLSNYSKYLILF